MLSSLSVSFWIFTEHITSAEVHCDTPPRSVFSANEWELDENSRKLVNFTTDPLYQPFATPVSFAPHSSMKYERSEWLVSSSTIDPAGGMSDVAAASTTSPPDPSLEDADFSETMRYISQMLMEDNFEKKPSMFYDPLSLQVTKKSFYDALRKDHPLSPNQHPLEARLSGCGTGTHIFYASLSSKRISSANMLRAYSVVISVCPFRKFAYFFLQIR